MANVIKKRLFTPTFPSFNSPPETYQNQLAIETQGTHLNGEEMTTPDRTLDGSNKIFFYKHTSWD